MNTPWRAFSLLLIASLLCLLPACARVLRSCGASIILFGPTRLFLECPPPGFQQRDQGTDTTEQPGPP